MQNLSDLINYSVISSLKDDTPEGKSIVELGKKQGTTVEADEYENLDFIEFTAQTRMSGVDLIRWKKSKKRSSGFNKEIRY